MALFVLLGALCWVKRFVFGFSYFIPVFVFALRVLGPSCPLFWSDFCSCSGGLGKRELGLGVEISF